jgi:transaldolase / glucose-6-phosphate isomerase
VSAPAGAAGAGGSSRTDLAAFEAAVNARLAAWDRSEFGLRFWRRDPTLWPEAEADEVPARMGWLELPESMAERVEDLTDYADEVREDGFQRIVLLGMGGSSLAPEVLARTFGRPKGYPELAVLDSTHPESVRTALGGHPIDEVFFVVSSKSGTTLEPNSFLAYFWDRAAGAGADPGRQFCAVTDPASPLAAVAESKGFRQCFTASPDVGGRYSALTEFGLVPGALAGVPIRRLVEHAGRMAKRCGGSVLPAQNPGFRLGAELGELARLGRDKVTFLASPSLASFPAWAEQLIAESTGKGGKGIVPVAGEVDPLERYTSSDAVLVYLALRGEEDEELDGKLGEVEDAGTPVLAAPLPDKHELAAEFFRWEVAIAAAGTILGIDPFNQPDVELAKELARQAMASGASAGSAPPRVGPGPAALSTPVAQWLASARPDDYVGIQAYLARSEATDAALLALRGALRARTKLTTTLGYGPRFLHSTGQLHKGGPNTGLFLQIVDQPAEDETVPPGPMTFGRILRAQADGDAMALLKRQRRILEVDVGPDPIAGLRALEASVRAAHS